MGKGGKGRPKMRGGRGFSGYGVRSGNDGRWDPEDQERERGPGRGHDPGRDLRDLRDLYEDLQDPVSDEFIWPDYGDEDED